MASTEMYKSFNDPVHGNILLHPLLVRIIDTPEFQRLRNIKQLGAAYFVYPGAQHNRFEHSIGTAHLAGKVVRHLKENQDREEKLHSGYVQKDGGGHKDNENKGHESHKITDKDILCVEIAGLCHDLGHGPFSHLFDSNFLNRKEIKGRFQKEEEEYPDNWTHEKQSCKIFRRILSRFEQQEDYKMFSEDRLDDNDKIFVEELIDGPEKDGDYKGRPNKIYLYDIISNKESGVDVDKWDYFARDCHHLGIANGFDHNRYIRLMRVAEDDVNKKRLCVRDKESFNLYQMFHTRFTLHKRAYQHKVVNAIGHMICDALCKADEYVKIPKDDGSFIRILDCVKEENLDAYIRLDDRVLQMIEHSKAGSPGRDIVMRILQRDHYRCVADKTLSPSQELEETQIRKEIASAGRGLNPDNIAVSVVKFNYGKKEKDPVQFCWFYTKDDPDVATKIPREEVSRMLPEIFQENRLQVFSKVTEDRDKVLEAFNQWYKKTEPPPSATVSGFSGSEDIARNLETGSLASKSTKKTGGGRKY